MKKLLFLLLFPAFLTACMPPSVFGIPQQQWDQLTEQQRSEVIAGYNQRQQWDQLNQEQRGKIIAAYNQRQAQAASLPAVIAGEKPHSPRKSRKHDSKVKSKKSLSAGIFSSKHLLASSIIGSLKWMISD